MHKELLLTATLLAAPMLAIADGDVRPSPSPPPMPPVVEAPPQQQPVADVPPSVVAEAPPPLPVAVVPARGEGFGSDTRYWVASQIRGDQSVTELRPQSGEIASHVYDRYVKSFDYAIPEYFQRDSFGSSSSGGASTR